MDSFDEIVAELFGSMIDPDELYDVVSKQNDSSEMHVPKGLTTREQQRRQKRQAQVGLASNVVGLTAGGVAIGSALKDERMAAEEAPKAIKLLARAGKKIPNISPRAGKAGAIAATGALGLQALNVGGDAVANRVLSRESKKKVAKALGDIVNARRMGAITTDEAVGMAAEVVAKLDTSAKGIFDTVDQIAGEMPSKKVQAATQVVRTSAKAAKQAKKGIALAKKPVAQPITPNEAEPMSKSAPDVTWTAEIAKMDSDKRQVFGFAMVTHVDGEPVVDRQGDYTPLEEIEKAAYTYVIESRKGGDMHKRAGERGEIPLHTADLVESFVITPEKLEQMGLPENALPHGWWVGFKVNDDQQWADVVSKRRTGFSIHGSGKRRETVL